MLFRECFNILDFHNSIVNRRKYPVACFTFKEKNELSQIASKAGMGGG